MLQIYNTEEKNEKLISYAGQLYVIPGHSNILENLMGDKMAKEALSNALATAVQLITKQDVPNTFNQTSL